MVVLVLLTRPEESTQAVFAASGNNVNMQMRNRLAHRVVHRDEGALGIHSSFHCLRQKLRRSHYGASHVLGQIWQRRKMFARTKQHVPRKERVIVQECNRLLIP